MAVHGPEAELGQASEQRQRPAALVGDIGHTLLTRHFEAPRLLVVRGCAPRWQFCHVDDLASALELAAVGVVRGDLTVGCDGSLSQAEVESLSGLKSLELPARLTFSTAQRLHRLGVIPSPSAELRTWFTRGQLSAQRCTRPGSRSPCLGQLGYLGKLEVIGLLLVKQYTPVHGWRGVRR
jgi:hypothetical protein